MRFLERGKVLTLLNCMRNLAGSLLLAGGSEDAFNFYKIVNDLTPSYLKDIIPPLRRSLDGHQDTFFIKFVVILSPSCIVFLE